MGYEKVEEEEEAEIWEYGVQAEMPNLGIIEFMRNASKK